MLTVHTVINIITIVRVRHCAPPHRWSQDGWQVSLFRQAPFPSKLCEPAPRSPLRFDGWLCLPAWGVGLRRWSFRIVFEMSSWAVVTPEKRSVPVGAGRAFPPFSPDKSRTLVSSTALGPLLWKLRVPVLFPVPV